MKRPRFLHCRLAKPHVGQHGSYGAARLGEERPPFQRTLALSLEQHGATHTLPEQYYSNIIPYHIRLALVIPVSFFHPAFAVHRFSMIWKMFFS